MRPITVDELLARYDLFLLDAYGVLVDQSSALPGAAAFLARLRVAGKAFLIVSNDASRLPETTLARYRGFGLELALTQILTSGMLLRDHFAQAGLQGARCIVLGTSDSETYVRQAGGEVTAPDDATASVLVVADDDGYPFLETINAVVTVLLARLERGEHTVLLLPNPDLIFPMGDSAYGITAGAVAAMLEAVLGLRDPTGRLRFTQLGKPHPPLFEAATRRFAEIARARTVMIGDQLGTDILGARRFGLDAVLVTSGVGRVAEAQAAELPPTFTLDAVR